MIAGQKIDRTEKYEGSAASNNKLEIPFPADQGSSTSIEVITSPTLSGLLGMVV